MTRSVAGYGRYADDLRHVGCPRAKTDMTPCIARDGQLALAGEDGRLMSCVGCGARPQALLRELLGRPPATGTTDVLADRLRDLVREVTA